MASKRIPYWDTLKGFLIILVVFGHCGTAVGDNLLSVVYAFHMPLFVLVSGYFSKRSESFNFSSIKKLVILFFLFDFLYLLLDFFGEGISLRRLLKPGFSLWYILSLIFWRFFLQFVPVKLLNRKGLFLLLSFILSILVGFIHVGTELSFQRTFVFWPFFLLGYYFRQNNLIESVRKYNSLIPGLLFILLCFVCYFYLPVFYSNSYYSDPVLLSAATRLIQIFVALVLCILLINILPEKMGIITEFGKYTLLIYLLHPFFVKVLKVIISKFGYQPDIIASVLITFVTIFILYSIRNLKVFRYLV